MGHISERQISFLIPFDNPILIIWRKVKMIYFDGNVSSLIIVVALNIIAA